MGIQLRDLLGIHTLDSIYSRRIPDWDGVVAQIGLDGNVFRFIKHVGVGSDAATSWLSAINPLGEDAQARDIEGTHLFARAIVVVIRWRQSSHEDDVIYAVDESTGLVMFEVGTESDVDGDLSFVWEHKIEGYTPPWLTPIDPDPPVEIRGKQKHVGDRIRKRTPTGVCRRGYPRST